MIDLVMDTRNRGAPLVVEFLGLPGAGKTSVAQVTLTLLLAEGRGCAGRASLRRACGSRWAYGAGLAASLAARPGRLLSCLQLGVAVRPLRLERLRYVVKLLRWSHLYDRIAASDLEIAVLDQGLVQDAWSLLVHGEAWNPDRAERVLSRVLERERLRYAFVLFEVPVDVALDRISTRPRTTSRFEAMSRPVAEGLLTLHQQQLGWLAETAIRLTGASVLTLDGTDLLEFSSARVCAFLEAALEDAPR